MLGILLALLLLATGCEIRVVKSYPNCPEPLVEDLIEEYAGVAMGVGALWRPLKNVSVSLRQGVALEYQHKVRDRDSRPDVAWPKTTKTLLLRMPSPQLLTIIHF